MGPISYGRRPNSPDHFKQTKGIGSVEPSASADCTEVGHLSGEFQFSLFLSGDSTDIRNSRTRRLDRIFMLIYINQMEKMLLNFFFHFVL